MLMTNVLICSGCRTEIGPKTKDDGGLSFPFELVHASPQRCTRYASRPNPPAAPPAQTRQDRRRARWDAERAAQDAAAAARRDAPSAITETEGGSDLREPSWTQVIRHCSKLKPGEEIDESCFYCGSDAHWSSDCLTI
jgi:hypothetical protein